MLQRRSSLMLPFLLFPLLEPIKGKPNGLNSALLSYIMPITSYEDMKVGISVDFGTFGCFFVAVHIYEV